MYNHKGKEKPCSQFLYQMDLTRRILSVLHLASEDFMKGQDKDENLRLKLTAENVLSELLPHFHCSVLSSAKSPGWKTGQSSYLSFLNVVQKHERYTNKETNSFLEGSDFLKFLFKTVRLCSQHQKPDPFFFFFAFI